jgi:mRNA interferase HigB
MRIISRRALIEFGAKHTDCVEALNEWFLLVRKETWSIPQDFRSGFPGCVILPDNRVIFHIKGNHYRLIVQVNYKYQRMYIKFIGTHAEYDKIDANSVNQF